MRKQAFAILLIALMTVSVFAIAPAAALDASNINYDESTDSGGELAGDGTDSISGFNGSSDASVTLATEIDPSSTDGDLDEVTMNVTYEDDETEIEHHKETNGSPTSSADWLSTDHEGVTLTVDHSDLETIPVEAGGSTAVTFSVSFETDDGGDTIAEDSFEVTLEADDDYSVMYLHEDTEQFGDTVDHEERDPGFLSLADETPDWFTVEDERNVSSGNVTEVTMFLHGDMASDFNDVADGAENGDLIGSFAGYEGSENMLVLAFYGSANTDIVDEDDDTYLVYDDASDTLTLHVGEDFDEDEIDILAANKPLASLDQVGFGDLRGVLGIQSAISLTIGSMMMGVSTTAAMLGLLGIRWRDTE